MTSKEIVKKAIHFDNPTRMPHNFDSNRTPCNNFYGDDFIWCFIDKNPYHIEFNEKGDKIDEWGCIWESMGETFGEPKNFPLEGRENYDNFVIPDFDNLSRYKNIKKLVSNNKEQKYVLGMLPLGIFQIMIHLFGFEDFMYQVAGNTENYVKLVKRLTDKTIKCIENFADAGVDGIILIEDMGLQDRMMISPTMWEEIYYPEYKRMFKVAHDRGLDVFSHTCGHIVSILDMYIDAGLDVIQMDQQDNMTLEVLSEKFKGKVCFFNPLDIQTSLKLSDEELEKQALKMATLLGNEHGGFMAKTYPQPDAIHVTDHYMKVTTDGFKKASMKIYGE